MHLVGFLQYREFALRRSARGPARGVKKFALSLSHLSAYIQAAWRKFSVSGYLSALILKMFRLHHIRKQHRKLCEGEMRLSQRQDLAKCGVEPGCGRSFRHLVRLRDDVRYCGWRRMHSVEWILALS